VDASVPLLPLRLFNLFVTRCCGRFGYLTCICKTTGCGIIYRTERAGRLQDTREPSTAWPGPPDAPPMTMASPRPRKGPAAGRHRGGCHIIAQEPAGCYVLGCALRTPHSSSHHRCHPLNVHATSLLARDRVAKFYLSTLCRTTSQGICNSIYFGFHPVLDASHGEFLRHPPPPTNALSPACGPSPSLH
jgi:hypothetical protein